MTEITAELIIEVARTWLDTPFYYQSSLKGAGCDCSGFIRGVYEEVTGNKLTIPLYGPFWGISDKTEFFANTVANYLIPVDKNTAEIGDVLLFKVLPNMPSLHAAFLSARSGRATIIHSWDNRSRRDSKVVEISAVSWLPKVTHCFRFPGVM